MLCQAISKIAQTLAVLFIVSVASFTLLKLAPGDPVQVMLGSEYSPEAHASMMRELGLDRPVVEQYLTWAGNFLLGDWGTSYVACVGIFTYAFVEALPVTLTLAAAPLGIAILMGVPLGVLSAVRKDTVWDIGIAAWALRSRHFRPSFWAFSSSGS